MKAKRADVRLLVFGSILAVIYFIAASLGHQPVGSTAIGALIIFGFSAVVTFGALTRPSNESWALLRGDTTDERQGRIQELTAVISFQVINAAIVIGWLVAVARGHALSSPFTLLGFLSGTTQVVSKL